MEDVVNSVLDATLVIDKETPPKDTGKKSPGDKNREKNSDEEGTPTPGAAQTTCPAE